MFLFSFSSPLVGGDEGEGDFIAHLHSPPPIPPPSRGRVNVFFNIKIPLTPHPRNRRATKTALTIRYVILFYKKTDPLYQYLFTLGAESAFAFMSYITDINKSQACIHCSIPRFRKCLHGSRRQVV